MAAATHLYAIAIGSNRAHGRHGRPSGVVEAAIARLDQEFGLFDASPITLNAAREVIFMICGAAKAEALKQVLEGEYNPDEHPAQLLRNSLGNVSWLVDKDAASDLEGEYTEI